MFGRQYVFAETIWFCPVMCPSHYCRVRVTALRVRVIWNFVESESSYDLVESS